MEADREYFERRAIEERAAAAAAASDRVRTVHLELAERYDDLAQALGENRVRMGVAKSEA